MRAKVADVMEWNVTAVRASASFKQIAARLSGQSISALPVTDDDGIVIGVVSEADLMPKEAVESGLENHPGLSGLLHRTERGKAQGETAADLMSRPPVTVRAADLVSYAAHLMYERRIRCLPVVDSRGRLIGMVSRANVLRVFGRPDEEIRREITGQVVLEEFVTNPADYTVIVSNGIVTMAGVPESASVGRLILDAVRHVEGVVAVHDQLIYPSSHHAATPAMPFF